MEESKKVLRKLIKQVKHTKFKTLVKKLNKIKNKKLCKR